MKKRQKDKEKKREKEEMKKDRKGKRRNDKKTEKNDKNTERQCREAIIKDKSGQKDENSERPVLHSSLDDLVFGLFNPYVMIFTVSACKDLPQDPGHGQQRIP